MFFTIIIEVLQTFPIESILGDGRKKS